MGEYITPNQFDSKYGFKVTRPTMVPDRLEARDNGGTLVHMQEGPGDPGDPPPPPPPEREPITVGVAARWANLNDYTEGQTVFANVASFSGGTEGEVIWRYRWQTRGNADEQWANTPFINYTSSALEVESYPLGTGQVRFQCQGRDASVDPVALVEIALVSSSSQLLSPSAWSSFSSAFQ